MFSGIIEQTAKIDKLINTNKDSHIILKLDLSKVTLIVGDSVAINGVCLTVSSMENKFCRFDISPETLNLTAFKDLNTNDIVNIEFPLTLNKFISGHITTGHVGPLFGVTCRFLGAMSSGRVPTRTRMDKRPVGATGHSKQRTDMEPMES